MEDRQNKASDLFGLMDKIGRLYTARALGAQKAFLEHMQKAAVDPKLAMGVPSENPWQAWASYATDFAQRAVLFGDILRERGKDFGFSFENLNFDYEVALKRSRQVSDRLVKGVGFLMKKNNIAVHMGSAKLIAKDSVSVTDKDGKTTELKSTNIVIATGAQPMVPPAWKVDGKNILTYLEAILQPRLPKSAIIIGAGAIGVEFATIWSSYGLPVTIVEMLDELALDEEPITRFDLLTNQLPEAGVQSLGGRTITEISDKGVTVLDHHGRKTLIEADSVVIALGTKSVETLAEKAKEIVPEVFVIGDSKKPRKIIDATYEGAAIARLI